MSSWIKHLLYKLTALLLLGCSNANGEILVLIANDDANTSAITRVVSGIRRSTEAVDIRTISEDEVANYIASSEESHSAILLLGRQAIESDYIVNGDIPILLGGYTGDLDVAHDLPRISLNIDPAFALASMNKTGTPILNVHTLKASSSNNNVEIDALEKMNNADVAIEEAASERAIARGWFDILRRTDAGTDVLWILDDTFLDNTGTYRYIVETAWRRKLLVVSTIPSFADRGVSIGFIPVLPSYGELLITVANRLIDDNNYIPPQLLGGDTVRRVFNSRNLQRIGRRLPVDLDRGSHTDIVIK